MNMYEQMIAGIRDGDVLSALALADAWEEQGSAYIAAIWRQHAEQMIHAQSQASGNAEPVAS